MDETDELTNNVITMNNTISSNLLEESAKKQLDSLGLKKSKKSKKK